MNIIKASAIRALRTVIQTFIALCGTAAVITDVDWIAVFSGTALSGLLSFLQGILLGLPEAEEEEDE